jgi:hypothetical protein
MIKEKKPLSSIRNERATHHYSTSFHFGGQDRRADDVQKLVAEGKTRLMHNTLAASLLTLNRTSLPRIQDSRASSIFVHWPLDVSL